MTATYTVGTVTITTGQTRPARRYDNPAIVGNRITGVVYAPAGSHFPNRAANRRVASTFTPA